MPVTRYKFERLPSNWPLHGTNEAWATVVMAVTFVAGIAYIGFFSNDHAPKWLPKLVGCYAADGSRRGVTLTIDKYGAVRSRDLAVSASAEEDNMGVSLLPGRDILYDEQKDLYSVRETHAF